MVLFLPSSPTFSDTLRLRLTADYDRFRSGLPPDLRTHCLEAYGVDIAGQYAGSPIANPFGKASGQLSLNVRQVQRDAEARLGFVVLKTVIAEDEGGARTMGEWAIPETHMRVEPITGQDGTPGWTVTWKGRGWHEDFASYCRFFGEALDIAGKHGMPVAPSVKYHLPAAGEGNFSTGEYRFTTQELQKVWSARRPGPMPLEKDFSPTLAGDERSQEEQILLWLRRVPSLIREAALPPGVVLGVKLMNTAYPLHTQVEMLRALVDDAELAPDYLVCANRLFDPAREFEGKVGVAYGGPDLSQRNLEMLRLTLEAAAQGGLQRPLPSISATGNILTGKTAVEYGLSGARSCQMHTVFQLPSTEFGGAMRNKSAAVLHHLLFHPHSGLIVWLLHLGEQAGHAVHWRDLPDLGRATLGASV